MIPAKTTHDEVAACRYAALGALASDAHSGEMLGRSEKVVSAQLTPFSVLRPVPAQAQECSFVLALLW